MTGAYSRLIIASTGNSSHSEPEPYTGMYIILILLPTYCTVQYMFWIHKMLNLSAGSEHLLLNT